MSPRRLGLLPGPLVLTPALVLALAACSAASCPAALALPAPAGKQAGKPAQAAHSLSKLLGASCEGEGLVEEALNTVTIGVSGAAKCTASAVGGLAGGAVGAAAGSVLDQLTRWIIGGASAATGFLAKELQDTTTPQLQSMWFQAQFAPMADLGAALGLLVTLIAFASAAARRDPAALAGALAGVLRAGLGTALVVALTVLGLEVADEISRAVLSGSPHAFWNTVAHAWGTSGFGGFASSELAALIALVEMFFTFDVLLELIVRDAAIYIAVLFFPVVLAASIWPALSSWTSRLGRLLLLFVILKPVALIVLCFAGNAAAAGLSFGGGFSASAGTILAAVVIFALASSTPWALMYLLAADAEGAYIAASVRSAAGGALSGTASGALAGGTAGRLARGLGKTGGSPGSQSGSRRGGGGRPGGGLNGPGGGGSGGGPSAPGDGQPAAGGGAASGGSGGEAFEADALSVTGAAVGAGSVGAAAGVGARAAAASGVSSPASSAQSPPDAAAGLAGEQAGRHAGAGGSMPAGGPDPFAATTGGAPSRAGGRPATPVSAPQQERAMPPSAKASSAPMPPGQASRPFAAAGARTRPSEAGGARDEQEPGEEPTERSPGRPSAPSAPTPPLPPSAPSLRLVREEPRNEDNEEVK